MTCVPPLLALLHLPWMLLGLVVLAVPPLIHLLNRRRYDVIDWGAMQFLKVSERTRRRLVVEDWLLLLVRMGLLAVLVVALAGPFLDLPSQSTAASRPPIDVVLILDGSASMAVPEKPGGPTPLEQARRWARKLIDELGNGSTVALLVARDQVQPLVGNLSQDPARLRAALDQFVEPSGSCNGPGALRAARAILAGGQNTQQEIVFLTDFTQHGWADPDSQLRWELLAREIHHDTPSSPRLWLVHCAPNRPARPPNYALTALDTNRLVVRVDREVRFRGEMTVSGLTEYHPPRRLRLLINGKHVRDLPPPGGSPGQNLPIPADGKVVFTFTHRFGQPGIQWIRVALEVDPPPSEQPAGFTPRDWMPGDNHRDLILEVLPTLPVLLVSDETARRQGDFLRDALAPARDPQPAVRLQQLGPRDLTPESLLGRDRPLVLILHDVPQLDRPALKAVHSYLASGGGVLVTLGEHVHLDWYNQTLYLGGTGWLPARLTQMQGDRQRFSEAARIDPASLTHPILQLFAGQTGSSLAEVRFPRWWQLDPAGDANQVGLLRTPQTTAPLFVERSYQRGRVLVCAHPLDASWGGNLIDLPAYVPLVHEAVHFLAGAGSASYNLPAGQPFQYRVSETAKLADFQLRPPHQPSRTLGDGPDTYRARLVPQPGGQWLICEELRDVGVYELQTPDTLLYFVVQSDPREADLPACTPQQYQRLKDLLDLNRTDEPADLLQPPQAGSHRQELWSLLLLGLIGLLCVELYLTRRMVRQRA